MGPSGSGTRRRRSSAGAGRFSMCSTPWSTWGRRPRPCTAKVLADGWVGVCQYVGGELGREDTPARRAALDGLIGYMKNHVGRMAYRSRLAEGRSIGSGLIEGQVKTLGLRLKARGARWVERNAERM